MSEQEVLAQLRDIHLPADLAGGTSVAFALWPFLVLAGMAMLVLILRHIGRNRWRRAARKELERITAIQDAGAQWTMLLAFAATLSERSGRSMKLPEIAYVRPDAIGAAERTDFVTFLREELAR